ncbi:FkbM family methyltransferase [Vibrio tubiashii]|uniref:FkbM family methyltransferase n=1 Tax=Vibrio tubiashii TaxID=29498 RepID=A0AAE5GSD7_9VIBR|nr:FkbM family methyltransferase [Vibrio tubiashii]NOI82314.1 FkbM family methyltransferase [Vibrio tubiashii]
MIILRRILKFALIPAISLYRSILLRFDKNIFATLFNLKSIILLSPARIYWNDDIFVVKDKKIDNFEYRFRHQTQGNMAYEFGIIKRAQDLANCYFLNEIEFKDDDVFLDCGANVGDLKIWFELQNIAIEYIGFEPSPIEFNCLKENVSPSVVHNIGLWKESGELEFFVSSQGADSSLIEPPSFDTQIKVPVGTLDSYVDTKVKLLKLEAEGAEPEILEGLGEKLNCIEYISADLGFERGANCESTLVPVTNFLLERGFELVNVSHGRVCALFKNKYIESTIAMDENTSSKNH